MKPSPKMAKFVLTTWAACLARQKPVSTKAKPACMKTTSTAPRTTHSRLIDVVRTSVSDGSSVWASAGAASRTSTSAPKGNAANQCFFFMSPHFLGDRHSVETRAIGDEPKDLSDLHLNLGRRNYVDVNRELPIRDGNLTTFCLCT